MFRDERQCVGTPLKEAIVRLTGAFFLKQYDEWNPQRECSVNLETIAPISESTGSVPAIAR